MTEFRRSQNASIIQDEMAALPGMSSKWKERHYWNEFNKFRRQFFSNIHVPIKPSETEREELRRQFTAWVRDGNDWWAGVWADEDPGIADWHVNQYLRMRKGDTPAAKKKAGERAEIESSIGDAGPSQTAPPSTSTNQYYDAVRDR